MCVLSVRGGSDVPPWMYMRVFFAVGLPKKGRAHEHSRFHVIRPYPTRYSMRSLQSQHCLPVFKKKKKVDAHRAPAEISLLFAPPTQQRVNLTIGIHFFHLILSCLMFPPPIKMHRVRSTTLILCVDA